jgi:hypothetical protein
MIEDGAAEHDELDELYARATHSREPNCWPDGYRNAPYPFSRLVRMKVDDRAFIDIKYEDREEVFKAIKKFHRYWRKTIKVEFYISMHLEGYGADVPNTCVVRLQRIR